MKKFLSKKISWPWILTWIVAITWLRVTIEEILLQYPLELSFFQQHLRFYLENIYYFIILFLLLVYFISLITKKTMIKIANIGIKIFPLIIIPPLIDYYFFGRTSGYLYGSIKNFWSNVFTFGFAAGEAGWGISILILAAVIIICTYVYSIQKSISKTILACLGASTIIMLLSTPEIFFGDYADFFYLHFLPNYYFFPLLILGSFLYHRQNKEKYKALIKNIRPIRAFMFILASITGGFVILNYGIIPNLYKIFLSATAIFFAWEFSVIINDIYDQKIDRITNKSRPLPKKILKIKEYRFISIIFVFFSLSFAAIINFATFLATVIWIILGYIYSVPPFRLRKNVFGNLIIGIALLISFIIGQLTSSNFIILGNKQNLLFYLILLLFGTIVSLTKDFKDIAGDSKGEIKNIFLFFGEKKGKKIMNFLLFICLTIPVLFMDKLLRIIVIILFALLTCYIYQKKINEKIVYLMAGLEGLYIYLCLYFFR